MAMINRREFFEKSALGLLALSGTAGVKSMAWGSVDKVDQANEKKAVISLVKTGDRKSGARRAIELLRTNPAMEWSLFQRFPALAEGLPRIPLAKLPTPIHRMKGLESSLGGGELWVKRDDSSSPEYGGNKPRKLELILARAKERDAKTLITFGGLGTNHGLATAIFGKKLGFKVILVLTPQPVNDFVIRNLFLMKHFEAEIFPTKGPLYAALKP
jgi:hypothetical protein